MAINPQNYSDYEEIATVLKYYTDAAKAGDGKAMARAFHPEATMFTIADGKASITPIQGLFDWAGGLGPAKDIKSMVTCIDLAGTVALVRIEVDNWLGARYTDMFTMMKFPGQGWLIANKVFHTY